MRLRLSVRFCGTGRGRLRTRPAASIRAPDGVADAPIAAIAATNESKANSQSAMYENYGKDPQSVIRTACDERLARRREGGARREDRPVRDGQGRRSPRGHRFQDQEGGEPSEADRQTGSCGAAQ